MKTQWLHRRRNFAANYWLQENFKMMKKKRKLGLLILWMFTLLACDQDFPGGDPGEDSNYARGSYFLNAELSLQTGAPPIFINWAVVDDDPTSKDAYNHYLIADNALYSVFSTNLYNVDTSTTAQQVIKKYEEEYGYRYGNVNYRGLGFCFYHPQEGAWDAASVFDFFQEGKPILFDTIPGSLEIGYNKNAKNMFGNPAWGLITNQDSNTSGTFMIDKIEEVEGAPGVWGLQVTATFECRLYKQYINEPFADLIGSASFFVPFMN